MAHELMKEAWIITGGSRGLGLEIAELFHQKGIRVYDLSRSGSGPFHRTCDISQPAEAHRVMAKLMEEIFQESGWSRIGFIHNAATLGPVSLLEHLDTQDVKVNIQTNVVSFFSLISNFLSAMNQTTIPGFVVSISSGAALRGIPGWGLYCASKAAGDQLIRVIAQETGPQITPIIFDPGIMDTKMQEEIRSQTEEKFPLVKQFREYKATGKLQNPATVAAKLVALIDGEYGELDRGARYAARDLG
jgi:benzil reductase ((S)-benzoin forming)